MNDNASKQYFHFTLGEYEGDLNVDEQLLADLIAACQAVAAKINTLKPPAGAA